MVNGEKTGECEVKLSSNVVVFSLRDAFQQDIDDAQQFNLVSLL